MCTSYVLHISHPTRALEKKIYDLWIIRRNYLIEGQLLDIDVLRVDRYICVSKIINVAYQYERRWDAKPHITIWEDAYTVSEIVDIVKGASVLTVIYIYRVPDTPSRVLHGRVEYIYLYDHLLVLVVCLYQPGTRQSPIMYKHVYKTQLMSTKHSSRLQNTAHVYKTQLMSTKHSSRLQNTAHVYKNTAHVYKNTAHVYKTQLTSTKHSSRL